MTDDKGQKPVVNTKKHIARLERERRQTEFLKYTFIAILVIVAGLVIWGILDTQVFQLQKPVAKVGDVEITRQEMQTRVKIERNGLLQTFMQYQQFAEMFGMDMSTQTNQIQQQLDDLQGLGQGSIESLVDEELIRQEAAKRGITITEAEIEEAVQGAYRFYPNGSPTATITFTPPITPTTSDDIYKYITPTPTITNTPEATNTPEPTVTQTTGPTVTGTIIPSETPTATISPTATNSPTPEPTSTPTLPPTPTVDPSLPTETPFPTSTPFTLDGFKSEYEKGIAYFSKFGLDEAGYRRFFETDLLRKKLYEQVTADVSTVAKQVRARHILVTDEAAAQDVIARLNKGEDFGALAAELSQDPGSGAQGGDLGWFGKGQMVAPFEEAAFSLKVGEISQPVQSDFGWHIIQVIATEDRLLTADEWQQARDAAFEEFLNNLRTEYGVEIKDATEWLSYVPDEPNFFTLATEIAVTATAEAKKSPTPLP